MSEIISEEAAKAKAKALRQILAEKGVELNHQSCLDVVARLEGEKSWLALNAKQVEAAKSAARAQERSPMPGASQVRKFGTKPVTAVQTLADFYSAGVGAPELLALVFGPAFSEMPAGTDIREYPHEVVFTNPEGNRVNQEFYRSKEHAEHEMKAWGPREEGWHADYAFILDWRAEGGHLRQHVVRVTRGPGSEFFDRYETEAQALRCVRAWKRLSYNGVSAEYLGTSALRP